MKRLAAASALPILVAALFDPARVTLTALAYHLANDGQSAYNGSAAAETVGRLAALDLAD